MAKRGRPQRALSLRTRIALSSAVIIELVLIVGAIGFATVLHANLVEGVRASAESDASAIASQIDDSGVDSLGLDTDNDDRIVTITRDGQTLFTTDDIASFTLDGDSGTATLQDEPHAFLLVADEDDGLTVVVGRSLEEVDAATGAVTGLLVVAVPLLGLVIAILCWVVVGRALRPVERMRREVDTVTSANLHTRIDDPGTDDEIGRLATTMNSMLDRLDRSQAAQRRFVSDASHELKSPLASLRQYAEVARAYPDRMTSAELSEAVLDEGARLDRLVQNMLLLASADESSTTAVPVDLDDIVLAEAARLRATTSLQIDTSQVGPARVLGDAGRLAQLVRNLADNAARHASRRIALSLNGSLLAVDDDGAGVPVQERERIFERFVRLDDSRARDAGGSGLGLAIVRELSEAHGGSAAVTGSTLGGARFEVRLPAASDS